MDNDLDEAKRCRRRHKLAAFCTQDDDIIHKDTADMCAANLNFDQPGTFVQPCFVWTP